MSRSISALIAALIAIVTLAGASAAADYHLSPAQVDLIHILAPPPAPASARGRADLQCVLEAQRHRTLTEIESARADAQLSVFRFADVMGPRFKPQNLPFMTTFFARVTAAGEHAIAPAKKYFDRPRPHVADHEITPLVGNMNGYNSYPSGHATFAYETAILLAAMVPEKSAAIFARADRFAENRVIAGVHYPTDLAAGRICGSVIDNVLMHEPRFETDFARASAEVRHALALAASPAPMTQNRSTPPAVIIGSTYDSSCPCF
ncbi:MAG TPA: phosphatase PAP2 family protein [Candidatus Binataceae bacterium]|nr:phosphatase PAP2 family protein [Candidatus Binataceae bacterium]